MAAFVHSLAAFLQRELFRVYIVSCNLLRLQMLRIVLYSSYFKLQMRWLSSLTPVTYLCKLLGIPCVAAFLQLELFRVYFSILYVTGCYYAIFFAVSRQILAKSVVCAIYPKSLHVRRGGKGLSTTAGCPPVRPGCLSSIPRGIDNAVPGVSGRCQQ
ncbi:hypothetical protein C3432_04545 [Citrobacter amalonaticus]|uniref:Uncharacterized protein n=1 Tax=Citrobacter amalonaticus TaxID=35703 RepID=A0A2S4S3Y0_CITAM|nr:hypothetical protein C3432_04545 [Citrobacter amalonaticus]POT78104.1 hypothetical protein C3436_12215 [Citrobacter amalonaticus]POU68556.1 hypothetical protein C3430_05750 [Citrobacter amalonaticus]POV08160.1 hypothetical protein C3424_05765 [Citrobacter amalonaticus]